MKKLRNKKMSFVKTKIDSGFDYIKSNLFGNMKEAIQKKSRLIFAFIGLAIFLSIIGIFLSVRNNYSHTSKDSVNLIPKSSIINMNGHLYIPIQII